MLTRKQFELLRFINERLKESGIPPSFDEMKDALARAVAERPEGQDALEVVREFILSSQQAEKNELDAQLHFCITSDPTLRSHLRARIAQLEDVIAPAIANDLGTSVNDARTQLVAASLTAAFNLLAEQGASKTRPWTPEELAAQVDPVFTFLRGGLDALKQPGKTRRR